MYNKVSNFVTLLIKARVVNSHDTDYINISIPAALFLLVSVFPWRCGVPCVRAVRAVRAVRVFGTQIIRIITIEFDPS